MKLGFNFTTFWCALTTAGIFFTTFPAKIYAAETNAPHARWERDIQAFEAADKTNPPPRRAVQMLGSSSMRMWKSAPEMLPGHTIFNRGFGGSQISDSLAFADRIVIPYEPKVILFYAGDNDLAAGKSPEQVAADFKALVRKIHGALPETRLAFISIKACPAREKNLAKVKEANELIRQYIETDQRLAYIDIFTPSLLPDGRPRSDLYIQDGLHANETGYKLWAGIIKPVLDRLDPPLSKKP